MVKLGQGLVFAASAVWICGAAEARAEILEFKAEIDGNCAGTGSPGTGTGTFTLDTDNGLFQYEIVFSGLTSTEEFAHIHGPISPACGSFGGGAIVITLPLGSPKVGAEILTTQQQQDLIDGLYYVNIHTTAFASGEISGVIFQDVPAPTVSEWGLAVLVLLLLTAGTTVLYRRHACARQ